MKRLFFLIGMGLIFFNSKAQHISIGVTGGIGSSWMSNVDDDADVIGKPSPNVGITYVYSTDNHWGFGADIKYSSEGVKYKYDNSDFTTRINSDFIRVPIRATYFFNDYGQSIRPKISLGPSFGFLIGGKIRTEDEDGEPTFEADTKDYFKAFDFGAQGSVGVNFRLAEDTWLSTDLAYYQGFLRQNENGSDNMMNSNLAFNLGLTFGIGGK